MRRRTRLKSLFDQNYDIKHNFLSFPVFFNFVRKITEKSQLTNGHFTTISGHFFARYINNFHKTEVPTFILRCIVCLNLNWIKSNNTILVCCLMFVVYSEETQIIPRTILHKITDSGVTPLNILTS